MQHDGDCQKLLEKLSVYVDGDASAEICHEVERHMATCDDCRVVIDTLHKTINLYQTLPAPDLPAGMQERLYISLGLEQENK